MASIMHVVNAAVGAVKKTYQNVWSGSADRTKQGKKSAMRHFDKYCESVQLPAFENWTKEQARGYLTVAMMQEFGGYLCVATNKTVNEQQEPTNTTSIGAHRFYFL